MVLRIGNKFDAKTRLGRQIYMHTNQILHKKSNGTTIYVIAEMLVSIIDLLKRVINLLKCVINLLKHEICIGNHNDSECN